MLPVCEPPLQNKCIWKVTTVQIDPRSLLILMEYFTPTAVTFFWAMEIEAVN